MARTTSPRLEGRPDRHGRLHLLVVGPDVGQWGTTVVRVLLGPPQVVRPPTPTHARRRRVGTVVKGRGRRLPAVEVLRRVVCAAAVVVEGLVHSWGFPTGSVLPLITRNRRRFETV